MTRKTERSKDQRKIQPTEIKPRLLGAEGRISVASRFILALLIGITGPLSSFSSVWANAQNNASVYGQQPLLEEPQINYPLYSEQAYASDEGSLYRNALQQFVAQQEVPPIAFDVVAEPSVIGPTGELALVVSITNNKKEAITGLQFTDALEPGMLFIGSDEKSLIFNQRANSVGLGLDQLGAGETFSFSYLLRITATPKAGRQDGEIWLHATQLTIASSSSTLKAEAVFWIGQPGESTRTEIDRVPPEGGRVEGDGAAILFPEDALGEEAIVKITTLPEGRPGPELQFEIELLETTGLTVSGDEIANSQKIEVGDVLEEPLEEKAFLEVDFAPVVDLEEIPAGMEPYVATYDEENDIWVKVPIVEVDLETNKITVETEHFSTWGGGIGNSLPQNGAGALLFDQPYTSLFTGGAQYSIPIWTPPGRAGMAPDITLSYSSRTADGVIGDVQAPWVGMGWNIDAVEIVREISTDENGYGYVNNFALTFNGELHTLQEDPDDPERYYTERASFLYIERHNAAIGNTPSSQNTSGEWWEVVATDGTRYRLGWNEDSEQMTLMYGYECTTALPCTAPNGAYAALGYAGVGTDAVAGRWRVDRILDRYGNFIDYGYTEEHPNPDSQIPAYDKASYIENIDFTGFMTGGLNGTVREEGTYQVHFVLAARSLVGDIGPLDFAIWDQWDNSLLDRIQICYGACNAQDTTTVRTYDFKYVAQPAPNADGTLTLASMTVDGGYTEGSITIPDTEAATVTFFYANKNNLTSGQSPNYNQLWAYPRLTEIHNGYGGELNYIYEDDRYEMANYTDILNYRVKEVQVENGIGLAAINKYLYLDPVYQSSPNNGTLIGYETVTQTNYELNGTSKILDAKHTFGVTGLDVGRELTTEWLDPASHSNCGQGGYPACIVLRKTRSTYVTDNSHAPFAGWNFRYLQQQENFERIGSNLYLVNKTTYLRSPANGNLVTQSDYLGAALYRKQVYEYVQNPSPAVYILDRVARQTLRDANNAVKADTRFKYDAGLILGELQFTQSLTGAGSQTVDSRYVYDTDAYENASYGNVVETRGYLEYGTAGTEPDGDYTSNSVEYDAALNTYPVVSTNDLDQSSHTEYLFGIGLPYQVTDPNGWVSSTTYDGLGRVLTTTAPGFSQANVQFIYPAVSEDGLGNNYVNAPYSLQMQILDTLGPSAPAYRSVWGVYDGLSRMLEQQVDAGGGSLLITETEYNAQGLVARQSLPYYSGGSPQFSETTYDFLGRATQTTQPGGITTSLVYSGLNTSVIDPNGHQVMRTADGLGRMISVKEFSGQYPDTQLYATTLYGYDIADRLTQVRDSQGNFTFMTYDKLGRKTDMDDPDMGQWSYEYNAVGTLAQQTDARGQDLGFTYDELGRLTEKEDLDAELNLSTYTYGTSAGEIGFRIGMDDGVGTTTWDYDEYGRSVTENRGIDGVGSFEFTTETDWLGRVASISYPDAEGNPDDEIVSYSYNALGQANNLSGSVAGQLAGLQYNALGQVEQIDLGTEDATIDNVFDATTHRLTQRNAFNITGDLIDFEYGYDNAGNIRSLVDNVLSETFSYEYDFLDRLTFVEGLDAEEGILYSQNFDYDSIGNILQVGNFVYPTPTPTPDLTATPTASPTPQPDGFEYDDNGNMITRTEGGVEWTQGFNPENRLKLLESSVGNWEFTYDGDGNRVKQDHEGEITIYLAGGSFEVRDAGDSDEVFKYYAIAGHRLAMSSDGATNYLLTDHLGSVVSVLDSDGLQIEGEKQRYMPYGEPRFAGGITATDFGFTGQRVLEGTGLMDYNARFYDARLGRFTQADSVGASQASPQNWNRYSYTSNNPINRIDPSGNSWCEYEEVCDSSGGGYKSNVTLGEVLKKGGLNGKNPDGSTRHCGLRPEKCQSDVERWIWEHIPSGVVISGGLSGQAGAFAEPGTYTENSYAVNWRAGCPEPSTSNGICVGPFEISFLQSQGEFVFFGTPHGLSGSIFRALSLVYGASRNSSLTSGSNIYGGNAAIDSGASASVFVANSQSVQNNGAAFIDPISNRTVDVHGVGLSVGGNAVPNAVDGGVYLGKSFTTSRAPSIWSALLFGIP